MNGYVRYGDRRPAADALVIVTSSARSWAVHTDDHGFFAFVNLAPEVYVVSVEKVGSNPGSIRARINSDQTTFLVFSFEFHCGARANASVGSDQRAQLFVSLDVRQLEQRPPDVGIPVPPVPIARDPSFMCL